MTYDQKVIKIRKDAKQFETNIYDMVEANGEGTYLKRLDAGLALEKTRRNPIHGGGGKLAGFLPRSRGRQGKIEV